MWKIKNWNDTFENADTRKRVRLGWFLCPTGVDSSGYIELMSHGTDGVQAFGVFLALCQWSATCLPVVRGLCARSDGRSLSVRQIASILRIHEEIVGKAFALLSSPDVNWMEFDDAEKTSENASDLGSLPLVCQSSASILPATCHKEKEKEKEKEREKEKEATYIRASENKKPEHSGGADEVVIPKKMRTPECLKAADRWMRYLDEKGLSDKRPDGAIALEAWWGQMARIGPEKFPEAVERSIARGMWNVAVLPDPAKEAGPKATKPDSNDDWLHTLNICRKYSSASQADTLARRDELTPQQLEAVREVGLHRIANCDSYDYKQVSEMFMHALRKVST